MNPQKIDATLRMMMVMDLAELGELSREGRMDLGLDADGEPVVGISVRKVGALPPVEGFEVESEVGEVVTGIVHFPALDELSELDEVVYVSAARSARGALHRTRRNYGLTMFDGHRIRGGADLWDGTGVTVGVVDLGFDVNHPAFRDFPGGPSRIRLYWDRAVPPRPGDTPGPGAVGTLYTKAQIDQYLLGPEAEPQVVNPDSHFDIQGGHGTHVAGIAAGRGPRFRGVASGSPLILVRMAPGEIPQLAAACDWIFSQAGGPCAINISMGSNSGGHDGTSDVEVALDRLLRDPATGAATPGRAIIVAAGNERQQIWHVAFPLSRDGGPDAPVLWASPNANTVADEMQFVCDGRNRLQIRLRSAAAPGTLRITPWIAIDPLGSVELAGPPVADLLAPAVAGGAPSKRFNFPDGTVAFIAHEELPASGDLSISVRIQPPGGAGAVIPQGHWLIELRNEPGRAVIGDALVHGYIRNDAPGSDANTGFLNQGLIRRRAVVPAGGLLHQDVAIPIGIARPVELFVEYDLAATLECQVRPGLGLGHDPTPFVGHGNVFVAGAGLLVAGPPVGGQVPFNPVGGGDPEIRIGHSVVAGRNRMHVSFRDPGDGVCQLRLGVPGRAGGEVPVELFLIQDESQFARFTVFRGEPRAIPEERVTVPLHAAPALPATVRLNVFHDDDLFDMVRVVVTIPRDPGGNLAPVRVRVPPANLREDVGWRPTPLIAPGNVETPYGAPLPPGAYALNGGPPAVREYVDGDCHVRIDYPAPGAAAPGVATIEVQNLVGGVIDPPRQGVYRIEIEGGAAIGAAALPVTADLVHIFDNTPNNHLPTLGSTFGDRGDFRTTEADEGPLAIPFLIGAGEIRSPDTVRLELLYPNSIDDLRVRVIRPDSRDMGFSVGPDNAVAADVGAVAPGGGGGAGVAVTAAPSPGTALSILHDRAAVFAGTRRVLVTLSAAAQGAYHLSGRWILEVTTPGQPGNVALVARIASDGRPATIDGFDQAGLAAREEGTLRIPGTAREILCVGATEVDRGTVEPTSFSSMGPARRPTWRLVAAARRTALPYPKPEMVAPGSAIASATAAMMGVAYKIENNRWTLLESGDGHILGMRTSWPQMAGALQQTQGLGAAPAEVDFTLAIPANGGTTARLIVRYPPALNLAVRVRQPAGAANPSGTRPVDSAGAEVVLPVAAAIALGAAVQANPDGRGLRYTLDDGTLVTIRQTGAGRAAVDLFRPGNPLRGGDWRLSVRHGAAAGAAVPAITVETEPARDDQGWPVIDQVTQTRVTATMAVAPVAAPAVSIVNVPIQMFGGTTRDVIVDLHYPAGPPAGPNPGGLRVLVRRPGPPVETTRSVDTAGAFLIDVPGSIAGVATPGGLDFVFAAANRVRIVHDAPTRRFRVTFQRNTAATRQMVPGIWQIVLINNDVAPAAPYDVFVTLHPLGHEAPFFIRPPRDFHPHSFVRRERLAVAAPQRWDFNIPAARRRPLEIEVVYDARDTVRVRVVMPDGQNTGFVTGVPPDTPVAGTQSAAFAPAVPGPLGIVYARAGQVRVTITNRVHPLSATRRQALVTIEPDGDGRLPEGIAQLEVEATAVGGGSNGVCEAWLTEPMHRRDSGTSMAAPHVTGVAALLLQQDHNRTQDDVKRRLLSTARSTALVVRGNRQLPGQWDPATGWGVLNAPEALLGHSGGELRHAAGGMPDAFGRTTGCPVACEDNCLLEATGPFRAPTGLRQARLAPHNQATASIGGDALPGCPRLADYLARFHTPAAAYVGAGATFEVAGVTGLSQPLLRDNTNRGTLTGFRPVTWEAALSAVASRLVDEWDDTAEILVVPGRPDAGVVREVLFNRWMHHLHDLLTAASSVKKCSCTCCPTDIAQSSPRVAYGSLFSRAAFDGIRGALGTGATTHDRGDLSLTKNVVLWGVNPAANAPALLRNLSAMKERLGDRLQVFAVDPASQGLPAFVRRIPILPGSDADLALALMLRIVGAPAVPLPEDPRFADAQRGVRQFLEAQSDNFADFLTHVRAVAATYLRAGGPGAEPADPLLVRCVHPTAAADAALAPSVARFRADFEALFQAYMNGPTATVLGTGPSRHLEGEEKTGYVTALAFLSGNVGVAGGGVSFGEDRNAEFNTSTFAQQHDSRRPEENVGEMGALETQQAVNLASIGADAPEGTRVMIWLDADPLTHLPDPERIEGLLTSSRVNVQIAPALDDSSRYADIILPLADTLQSYDLQVTKRSPWINLTQPVRARDAAEGPRPFARALHELHAAIRARLLEDYEGDLKPTINRPLHKLGPLVLPRDRRADIADFFTTPNRIRDLLTERLPGDEVTNIQDQLSRWYAGIHGGEPRAERDDGFDVQDEVKFFDRLQVDWIVEILRARYGEAELPLLLYNLLQRGTALDRLQFGDGRLGINPEGSTPRSRRVYLAERFADLQGTDGFQLAAERAPYRARVRSVDAGGTGRAGFPMRLIIGQSPAFDASRIPLPEQVAGGVVQQPTVVLNPDSPSLRGRVPAEGAVVSLVGNLTYTANETFEGVIARARVHLDRDVALETVWMTPGWHGLARGGQRAIRAIHSEEGEVPALFDNLVRIDAADHPVFRSSATRGAAPPKR